MRPALQAGSGLCWSLATWLLPAQVSAHPLAAEPPVFSVLNCILTIDKVEDSSHHFDYGVSFDDHELRPGDAELPDARTHQFFAVRGYVAMSAGDVVFARMDDAAGALHKLPHWMSRAELQRAAAAMPADYEGDFAADAVQPFDILEGNSEVAPWLQMITGSDVRIPITTREAASGFDWDLTVVPLGTYQIVGYIFSPPYNGWAARSGLVRVVERGEGPPAVTVERVAAQLFAGQGRRLRGCVAAASGAQLRIGWRPANQPEAEFEPAAPPMTVSSGEFEACLDNPGRDAVMEVRLELQDEAGQTVFHRPLEALTLFSRAAPCKESEIHCCPEKAQEPVDAGVENRDDDGGTPEDTSGGALFGGEAPDGSVSTAMNAADGAGCQCQAPRSRPGARAGWPFVVTLCVGLWVARRHRRAR